MDEFDIIINELLMKAKEGQSTLQRLINYEEVNMKRMLIQRIKVTHFPHRTTTSNGCKKPRRTSRPTPLKMSTNTLPNPMVQQPLTSTQRD